MSRLLSWCLLGALSLGSTAPAWAGNWTVARTLQGPFAVSSPPEAPRVQVNANGHAVMAWNATGMVRWAERPAGGGWQLSQGVPGAGTGAGPLALAIGRNEVLAVAWTTVATRYEASRLMVNVRPRGGSFGAAVQVGVGTGVYELRTGVSCDGAVTLVWSAAAGVYGSTLAGAPGAGSCDGAPSAGPWSPPLLLSSPGVGASLPELAVNDAGAALVVWQEGVAGQPATIAAALREAGAAWQPAQTVSAPSGQATWNPKPVLDAAGGAAVGYLDGSRMVVVRRPAGQAWGSPAVVSGTQNVYYPALAASAAGDLLAAWLTLDAGNNGSVWQAMAGGGGAFAAPSRVSAVSDNADWPSAAFAAEGSLAVVGWVDDASNTARAAVWTGGRWVRSALGGGWWGGQVPVSAGGGVAAAGWAAPNGGNPNSASLFGRTWR